ncbi:hypothetical protein PVAP13_8KG129541 [Panicum virgatum]|uniref:DUF936 domain-containing protein n=1 Tax=Panicum virgatum TaxID=38727 RepID=A0A8T0PC22_PANVG|nr:hypothetical protein PVAP13_8KG129541 [Panicum virgatum]
MRMTRAVRNLKRPRLSSLATLQRLSLTSVTQATMLPNRSPNSDFFSPPTSTSPAILLLLQSVPPPPPSRSRSIRAAMATLTLGVLLKLLQSMHTDDRIVGDHHSPVLQVTAVIPALIASTSDSLLLPSNGFLLNLSDGLHSTYASASSPPPAPSPVLPPRSRSLSAPPPAPACTSSSPPPRPLPPLMPSSGSETSDAVKRTVLGPKNAAVKPAPPPPGSIVKRRFSSLAPSKHRDLSLSMKSASASWGPSPSAKGASWASSPAGRGTPRATSPAPSKCVVPSLFVAKKENRRAAREPAIVVPSRYRQPSPAGGRGGAVSPSVGGRRASLSPSSRRLSGEGTGKKKVGVLVAGISKMTDLGNGSAVKPGRKSWDDPTTLQVL